MTRAEAIKALDEWTGRGDLDEGYCRVDFEANILAVEGALYMAITALREQEQREWISVKEQLPKAETEVLILARSGQRTIITTGMYEDGSKNTENSEWWWQETNGFEYDEELDAYIIPEGWWEYKHYNGDDEYNHPIDDVVTHWMPLPEPPKED